MSTTLCRTSKLHHPLEVTLETPLLVPAFSSKGFGVHKEGSEIKGRFAVVSEYLTDAMLLSAYDLEYGYLEPIQNAITELTILDSGGYEASDLDDLSTVYRQPIEPREWTVELLRKVYDAWLEHIPAVFVSYDHPNVHKSLQEQIDAARSLFSHYPRQMHTLLIKPETKHQRYVHVKNVIAHVEELRDFDMVGFTEKEIGNSILDRMINIADIRFAMDDKAVNIPIHVFGSLDPITSVLYFLAGAEVFDGLTWLRYGYQNGVASYVDNYGALRVGIDRGDEFVRAKAMQENLSYLIELKNQMWKYLLDESFAQFKLYSSFSSFFRDSYDLLRTKNRRLK